MERVEEDKIITWQAPEFEYNHKDVEWYWLTIILTAVLILVSLWQKNFLFVIFIIIAAIMLIFWGKEQPKIIRFTLDKNGLKIGTNHFYAYETLQGFHIHERSSIRELILKTKNKFHPYLFLIIYPQNISEIKEQLKKHLPEMEYDESFSEGISRIIGF